MDLLFHNNLVIRHAGPRIKSGAGFDPASRNKLDSGFRRNDGWYYFTFFKKLKYYSLFYYYKPFLAVAALLLLLASGCALVKTPPLVPAMPLKKIALFEYPEFADDMGYADLEQGILQSLSYLKKIPSTQTFIFGQDVYHTAHMIRSLEHFLAFIKTKPSQEMLNTYIVSHYRIYRSAGGDSGEVLFTGYYEPLLEGSLEKTDEYRFPIYARPDDLTTINLALFSSRYNGETIIGRYVNQTVVPYYNRAEIQAKDSCKVKAPIIVWVKDLVDLFFLHIQGSGKVRLNGGKTLNVHYHSTNGRPYRSIGNLLINKDKIPREEMSMQRIRAYLREHPEEVESVLNYNPSFVFFKLEPDGPLGSLEVKLTPGRSIASDWRLVPLSALAFIETKKPVIDDYGQILSWTACNRFVLNQDTGGVIRGPGRADLFWGNGNYAEIAAGHMQHPGTLYFLILKPEAL